MKKVFIAFAMSFLCVSLVSAQDVFLKSLKNCGNVRLAEIDFSSITIEGQSVADWSTSVYWDDDFDTEWAETQKNSAKRFVEEFNDQAESARLKVRVTTDSDKDVDAVLKALPVNTTRRGNVTVKFNLEGTDGSDMGEITLIGKGGSFGDFSNLQGDGWENLGKVIVKMMAKLK